MAWDLGECLQLFVEEAACRFEGRMPLLAWDQSVATSTRSERRLHGTRCKDGIRPGRPALHSTRVPDRPRPSKSRERNGRVGCRSAQGQSAHRPPSTSSTPPGAHPLPNPDGAGLPGCDLDAPPPRPLSHQTMAMDVDGGRTSYSAKAKSGARKGPEAGTIASGRGEERIRSGHCVAERGTGRTPTPTFMIFASASVEGSRRHRTATPSAARVRALSKRACVLLCAGRYGRADCQNANKDVDREDKRMTAVARGLRNGDELHCSLCGAGPARGPGVVRRSRRGAGRLRQAGRYLIRPCSCVAPPRRRRPDSPVLNTHTHTHLPARSLDDLDFARAPTLNTSHLTWPQHPSLAAPHPYPYPLTCPIITHL
ncbi:hypothetical protein DENSPDRAFT_452334 [Dentipellis sp. KUC8613]|nr:hypothetical protein DENSPDRAFT_452334 [Dentipellis sp. KUC8613]